MKIRRKILLIVTPIVLAPLVLLWVAVYLTLTPLLREADEMRNDIAELAELTEVSRQEARRRFETATMQAYGFGLANIGANIDGQLDAIDKSLLISAHRQELRALLGDPTNGELRVEVGRYFRHLMRAHDLVSANLVNREGRVVLEARRVSGDGGEATEGGEEPIAIDVWEANRSVVSGSWFENRSQSMEATGWSVYRRGSDQPESGVAIASGSVAIGPEGSDAVAGYLQLALPIRNLASEIRGPEELTSGVRLIGQDGVEYWRQETDVTSEADTDWEGSLYISQIIHSGLLNAEVRLPKKVVFTNLEPFDRLSDTLADNLNRVERANQKLKETVDRSELVVLLAMIGLATVALSLLSLFLGTVASRIESLNGATLRIRDGELDAPLPKISGDDELTMLRESIDDMRGRLRTQILELDRKVAARTQALDAANRHLEREVQEKRKAEQTAVAASSAKSEFLATMSHEIRTPLSGIIGGIHLLIKSDLDEDQRLLAEVVQSSGETLKTLLNDILDFSRIEAGKLVLEKRPFNLAGAIQEVCDTFQFNAREKGLEIHFDDQARDGLLRLGDDTRIKQIVYNLVGNAVKFTREGGVYVTLRESPEDPVDISIDVRDTGIGMSEDQVSRVFESFTQADSSVSREFGGTGLGLAISSRLASLMGGAIVAKSELGKGSTFTLRLAVPFAVADDMPSDEGEANSASALERAEGEVLFAEDNAPNRLILRRTLESAGFRVTEVSNGRACVNEAKRRQFDLIILDVSMPVLDGCSAAREIRQWEREQADRGRMLVLGLTANATSGQKRECLASGMDDVLFKPLSGSLLVEACVRLLKESKGQ